MVAVYPIWPRSWVGGQRVLSAQICVLNGIEGKHAVAIGSDQKLDMVVSIERMWGVTANAIFTLRDSWPHI